MRCHRLDIAGLVALSLLAAGNVSAQSTGSLIHLIVPAGTPLRLALDEKITIRKAAQQVTATLLEPVYAFDRGEAIQPERAASGSTPAPDSILNARLATALDSTASARGTRIEAVLTQPVFSADHRLILPEGTKLLGEVTFSQPARRFHRNGKLRFLFESVQAPDGAEQTLLGSLYSAESAQSRLAIDEEGGATTTNSSARFIAPAIGAIALAASLHGRPETDSDSPTPETVRGGPGSSAAGGFLGLAALGVVIGQVSRPAAVALAAFGLARTGYAAVFGKGRNVSFPADTSIQIRLAPGPGEKKK